jgi:hypothetical protein
VREEFLRSAIRASRGDTVQLTFEIEEGLREVVESRGAMAAIEQAVFKTVLQLKQDYYARQSAVQGRGTFVGTDKS